MKCFTYSNAFNSCNNPMHPSFTHPFNKYLLSASYVPGTVLSTRDTVNKLSKDPRPMALAFGVGWGKQNEF